MASEMHAAHKSSLHDLNRPKSQLQWRNDLQKTALLRIMELTSPKEWITLPPGFLRKPWGGLCQDILHSSQLSTSLHIVPCPDRWDWWMISSPVPSTGDILWLWAVSFPVSAPFVMRQLSSLFSPYSDSLHPTKRALNTDQVRRLIDGIQAARGSFTKTYVCIACCLCVYMQIHICAMMFICMCVHM